MTFYTLPPEDAANDLRNVLQMLDDDRIPLEQANQLRGRVAAALAKTERLKAMREVLEELRDWFADKADVTDGEFGPIPDAMMRWEIKIRQALGEQL